MSLAFADPVFTALFDDGGVGALWEAPAQIECWRRFEAAYSRALAASGLAEPAVAERAARAIEAARIAPSDLAKGTARDGLPIPAFVRLLKGEAGDDAEAVHRGATSQDVMDTALALTAQATNEVLDERIETVREALVRLDGRFGGVPFMARTRMQAALPVTVSRRIAIWSQGLDGAAARLAAAQPGIERLQLGGPVGDRREFGEDPQAFADGLADRLGLTAGTAWHTDRSGVAEYAGALSFLTGALGKIGQDVALMAHEGEIALAGAGGSSAMPHKQNPVRAELLVTLARYNAAQLGGLHQALVHEQERSGAAWTLEWLILPGMARATACAFGLASDLLAAVTRVGVEGDADFRGN